MDAVEPGGVYFVRAFDEMGVGIDAQTLVEEHLAVGTLSAADKEDEVVARGELRDIGHAVGYGAADGVETLEGGIWRNVLLDVVDDAVELVERLCGLRVEVDVVGEIELLDLVEGLDDNGVRVCLPHQSQHLGVTFLAEDDNLRGEW